MIRAEAGSKFQFNIAQFESFRFIHLTFCEYLAAAEAVERYRDGWNLLIEQQRRNWEESDPSLRTRLQDAIPFSIGLLAPHQRAAALEVVARLDDRRLMALAFLATKYYEHEAWREFLIEMQQHIVARQSSIANDEWLRELYLFTVVVSDAMNCRVHVPAIQIPIDMEAFYAELAAQHSDTMIRLIEAYAAHDAVAAYRVAELCAVNLLETAPQIIIRHCDQPPFLALASAAAMEDRAKVLQWAFCLAEAGLRQAVVAGALHRLESRGAWREVIEGTPKTVQWFWGRVVKRSVLTEALTVVRMFRCATRPAETTGISASLDKFGEIPALGQYEREFYFVQYVAFPVLISAYGIFPAILRTKSVRDFEVVIGQSLFSYGPGFAFFGMMLFMTVVFALVMRSLARIAVSRRRMNCNPHSPDLDLYNVVDLLVAVIPGLRAMRKSIYSISGSGVPINLIQGSFLDKEFRSAVLQYTKARFDEGPARGSRDR